MAKVTLRQALELGLKKHQADQFREAEEIYVQVLQHDPANADALHFLGVLKHQQGDNAAAAELLERSVRADGSIAMAHHNLGLVLGKLGRQDDAIAALRRALELQPNHAEAWNNLGVALRETGDTAAAHAACSRAVELNPKFAEAYNCLAAVLADQDRLDEAVACWRKAIALNGQFAEAHRNCAAALTRQQKFAEAVDLAQRAMRLDPKSAEDPDAKRNLALAFAGLARDSSRQGKLGEAIDAWQKAIALRDDDDADVHNDLANALANQGRADEALSHYRRALELRPDFASAHGNLLLAMNYLPQFDGAAFLSAHRDWERQQVGLTKARGSSSVGLANDRTVGRILRVGYVSPDFREHPVGRFIAPLLEKHDRTKVHVTCYSIRAGADDLTTRLRDASDEWRDLSALSDADVAEQIRRDGIDILVDLAGHTGHNRLKIFAGRAAPVQVAYLGYPNTTGLTTIDYRFTDDLADPPGATDAFHTEELVRLPKAFLCYVPLAEAPEVGDPPCLRDGRVTFGSFNNLAKITAETIGRWAEILLRVPGSRMLLKAGGLSDPATRQRLREQFCGRGIDPDRVETLPPTPTIAEHLAAYAQLDIALDTYPYHGTTTTLEALWMGVPVVCQAGSLHVSRVGVSILGNVGLRELVGSSASEYADIAVRLAEDREKLRHFRYGLRDLVRRSPLTDAARFAADVEEAYREMWKRWCDRAASPDEPQVIRF